MLNPDGQCLGVALCKIGKLLNFPVVEESVARLSTPKDAFYYMTTVPRRVVLIAVPSHRALLGGLMRIAAFCRGFPTIKFEEIRPNEVILAQRSMFQLYGVMRSEAHWIVFQRVNGKLSCWDPLLKLIRREFQGAVATPPERLLSLIGVSMIIR